jgi:hypothetical protein
MTVFPKQADPPDQNPAVVASGGQEERSGNLSNPPRRGSGCRSIGWRQEQCEPSLLPISVTMNLPSNFRLRAKLTSLLEQSVLAVIASIGLDAVHDRL